MPFSFVPSSGGTLSDAARLRKNLHHEIDDAFRLLAMYWLETGNRTKPILKDFVAERELAVSGRALKEAIYCLSYWRAGISPDGWTAMLSIFGDPAAVWRYMLHAVCVARSDRDLAKVAAALAERLLRQGHIDPAQVEREARSNPRFARMMQMVRIDRVGDPNRNHPSIASASRRAGGLAQIGEFLPSEVAAQNRQPAIGRGDQALAVDMAQRRAQA